MTSQTASRRFNRRDSGSRMGDAGDTQLPSNRRKPSGVNWMAASSGAVAASGVLSPATHHKLAGRGTTGPRSIRLGSAR